MGIISDYFSTYDPVTGPDCYDRLGASSTFEIVFGILIAFGVYISWLPQQVEFIRKKTTFGVSPIYMLLTQVANWAPFINALYDDFEDFRCCTYVSFWECQEIMIPIYQLFISVFSVFCIHVLYVKYYDPNDPNDLIKQEELEFMNINTNTEDGEDIFEEQQRALKRKKGQRVQIIIFAIYYVCALATIIIGFIILDIANPYSFPINSFSFTLGMISVVAVLIQFTPQIYTTYTLKTGGALSLLMLILQSPGTWIWWFYLLDSQKFSTWASTLVAATQVTILLFQVLYYDYFKTRMRAFCEKRGLCRPTLERLE